jgi:hypothetical protein
METELSLTRQTADRRAEASQTPQTETRQTQISDTQIPDTRIPQDETLQDETLQTQARRAHARHELRTLTYACLDQANGGIVRDISHEGVGLQVVAAVRPHQQLRVRFELGHPRVRVETRGEVSWATRSGQCGVRFIDLSPKAARQINEWIFGNLLEETSRQSEREGSLFALDLAGATDGLAADGLMVSAAPVSAIRLPARPDPLQPATLQSLASTELDWLSQALSGRGLIWTINALVIVAALLLFAVVFLSITGELPRWPLATASAATIFVGGLYWGFFRLFGKSSPGERLARLAGWDLAEDTEEYDARFR